MAAEKVTKSGISWGQQVRILGLVSVYIATCSFLIRLNKYLMAPGRFPHSMALTALHMLFSSLVMSLLYIVKPSSFPGMAITAGRRFEVLMWFAPVGLLFAVALFAGNQAYLYCNVAFLQFMKEGNVIIIFFFSCAIGLQTLNRVKAAVLCWIISASACCVTSDLQFVMVGAMLNFTSQVAGCARSVIGEYIMNRTSMKLDAFTYTLFSAPFCLLALSAGNVLTWDPQIKGDFAVWLVPVMGSCVLALLLDVTVATVIKEVSAVGFTFASMTKDIVIVVLSAIAFGEPVSGIQVASFTVVLCGIAFWSLMKSVPDHPLVLTVERLMGLPAGTDGNNVDEQTPLTSAPKEKSLV